ncbi:hypothetical protein Msi02_52680 [Microbispora siamensis]|uniref:Uncharacterized protein n=1 Tax=Microbispora siamensis TaxID=564413 RepID=A0ABQ4GSN3_9ACTN|nr:hypothetical protein Msi02_52680 [Microbispora siamensis]
MPIVTATTAVLTTRFIDLPPVHIPFHESGNDEPKNPRASASTPTKTSAFLSLPITAESPADQGMPGGQPAGKVGISSTGRPLRGHPNPASGESDGKHGAQALRQIFPLTFSDAPTDLATRPDRGRR